MMKISLFAVIILCLFQNIWGQASDTLVIRAQDNMHMNYYGNFDQDVLFPDSSLKSRKILMRLRLGCPAPKCSGWDYTTQIFLMPKNGNDTIEIARFITPYASDKTPSWKNDYYYDLTDLAPVLRDSATIRSFYSGWTDGFTITLDFFFISGTPPRDVVSVKNVYSSRLNTFYLGHLTYPIENYLIPKNYTWDAGASMAALKNTISGHGGDSYQNCSEFCNKYYELYVDGSQLLTKNIWRNNCGKNNLYPQTGTWIHNRANWCPGDKVGVFHHELTNDIFNDPFEINIDMQTYPYQDTNNGGASYTWESQLFQYKAINFANDASIEEIISPNKHNEYFRSNAICEDPKVVIRNNGSSTLTSATIFFGPKNGPYESYNWTGTLDFMATAEVSLPSTPNLLVGASEFEAFISMPNDQYAVNDTMRSEYVQPATFPSYFHVEFKSNNIANQNRWTLTDGNGTVIKQRFGSAANTTYRDTFNLADGCYTFTLLDVQGINTGCDGLSWWANSAQGTGYVYFWDNLDQIVYDVPKDFGCEIVKRFRVSSASKINTTRLDNPFFDVFPNPSSGLFTIKWLLPPTETFNEIKIYNSMGVCVKTLPMSNLQEIELDLSTFASGVYLVQTQNGKQTYVQKIIKD